MACSQGLLAGKVTSHKGLNFGVSYDECSSPSAKATIGEGGEGGKGGKGRGQGWEGRGGGGKGEGGVQFRLGQDTTRTQLARLLIVFRRPLAHLRLCFS